VTRWVSGPKGWLTNTGFMRLDACSGLRRLRARHRQRISKNEQRYWQVNLAGPQQAYPFPRSCGDGGGHPGVLGRSPKLVKRGSTDQMRLDIEGVLDRTVAGEETLG
jgi:hypothetical protein